MLKGDSAFLSCLDLESHPVELIRQLGINEPDLFTHARDRLVQRQSSTQHNAQHVGCVRQGCHQTQAVPIAQVHENLFGNEVSKHQSSRHAEQPKRELLIL